jgi:hypothetical protein
MWGQALFIIALPLGKSSGMVLCTIAGIITTKHGSLQTTSGHARSSFLLLFLLIIFVLSSYIKFFLFIINLDLNQTLYLECGKNNFLKYFFLKIKIIIFVINRKILKNIKKI